MHDPTVVYSDSQAAIAALRKPKLSTKMKHVDIRFHKLRELLTVNSDDSFSDPSPHIALAYEPTTSQPADVLTKQLPRPSFEWHRDRLLNGTLVPHAAVDPSSPADASPAGRPLFRLFLSGEAQLKGRSSIVLKAVRI